MVRLTRTVRFSINPAKADDRARDRNGTGGIPAMTGIGAYYELDAECVGTPDPATGYLINIKAIDQAVRTSAIPVIAGAIREGPAREPSSLLPAIITSLRADLPGLATLRWRLTPTYTVEMETADMSHAVIKQIFEIAAAHRLHADELSDADNQRVFGKCNNPSGHGHNYRFQPAVDVRLDAEPVAAKPGGGGGEGGDGVRAEAGIWSLAELESVTEQTIVRRFDHKHLNLDTPEFGRDGLNPSVENIARVFFDLLAPQIREHSGGRASLRAMTVWETEKTSATYPAEPPRVR